MGREHDYEIRTGLFKPKVPVFKTPFTKDDYYYLVSEECNITSFGIHDQRTGEVKFYDTTTDNMPSFSPLFKFSFGDVNVIKTLKYMVIGVGFISAIRVLKYKPKNPFSVDQKTMDKIRKNIEMASNSTNPKIIHQGDGNGFKQAD